VFETTTGQNSNNTISSFGIEALFNSRAFSVACCVACYVAASASTAIDVT
jgi:hypothetical protein